MSVLRHARREGSGPKENRREMVISCAPAAAHSAPPGCTRATTDDGVTLLRAAHCARGELSRPLTTRRGRRARPAAWLGRVPRGFWSEPGKTREGGMWARSLLPSTLGLRHRRSISASGVVDVRPRLRRVRGWARAPRRAGDRKKKGRERGVRRGWGDSSLLLVWKHHPRESADGTHFVDGKRKKSASSDFGPAEQSCPPPLAVRPRPPKDQVSLL